MARMGVTSATATLCLIGAVLHGQIRTLGTDPCTGPETCTQAHYQYWTTVSSDPGQYLRYGEFQILSITHNFPIDMPWSDGDWSVITAPLPGYEDLLTNAEG